MAGCSMTTKGRPLAQDGYEAELDSINTFMALKNKSDVSGTSGSAQSQAEIKPEYLVGPHILKKHKSKKVFVFPTSSSVNTLKSEIPQLSLSCEHTNIHSS